MSVKTCKSCGKAECTYSMPIECLRDRYPTCFTQQDCPGWEQRTDSLEQVARDMLEFVYHCTAKFPNADCRGCTYNDYDAGTTRYDEGQCTAVMKITGRLRALGIEVEP